MISASRNKTPGVAWRGFPATVITSWRCLSSSPFPGLLFHLMSLTWCRGPDSSFYYVAISIMFNVYILSCHGKCTYATYIHNTCYISRCNLSLLMIGGRSVEGGRRTDPCSRRRVNTPPARRPFPPPPAAALQLNVLSLSLSLPPHLSQYTMKETTNNKLDIYFTCIYS